MVASNRWIIEFPNGDIVFLAASYANKEAALVPTSVGTKARKLPKDAYHTYADFKFTMQLRRQNRMK